MKRLRHKVGLGLLAASTAFVTLGTPVEPTGADPLLSKAFVGVGSDTTQDIFNAFAGAGPFATPAGLGGTRAYTPLFSSATSGNRPIASWDAQDPQGSICISPKLNAGSIDRPNGSTEGVRALSKAAQGVRWDAGRGCSPAAATNNVSGQIDFARSSSGPNATTFPGTQLTYVPFARDGLGYAYIDKNGNGTFAGGLTTDELRAGYGTGNIASPTGTITKNGETVRVCGIQAGSGTIRSWDRAMGNSGNGTTVNASAANSGCGNTYQEHNGDAWFNSAFVVALPADENVIIPFSAAQWISQANATSLDNSAATRAGGGDLGAITLSSSGVNLGKPYTGTPPNLAPNATFYADPTFGRDMYVVVPTSKLSLTTGDAALRSLFRGPTSAICSANAQAIDSALGFAPTPSVACGTTTLTQGYIN